MQDLLNHLTALFEARRMDTHPADRWQSEGRAAFQRQLWSMVAAGEPIRFSMLGYPFKSQNHRDKTLGDLPDLAEELSLINFGDFGDEIRAIYPPGARFSLVSDGLAFNEVWGISESTTRTYADEVRSMSSGLPIDWFDLSTFYPGLATSVARDKLMTQFAPSEAELERRILTDQNVNWLYRGMLIFLEAETAIWPFEGSNSEKRRQLKARTRRSMLVNEAYSSLIQQELGPTHIRLSMHKSDNTKKFSFRLYPGPSTPRLWTSPWHAAIAQTKDLIETVHVSQARDRHLELVHFHGRPYYYQGVA